MLLFFFGLIYFSFQVTAGAKDTFGQAAVGGITVYLAMHVIVNIGMMVGFLPITGVPLILSDIWRVLCGIIDDGSGDFTKYL